MSVFNICVSAETVNDGIITEWHDKNHAPVACDYTECRLPFEEHDRITEIHNSDGSMTAYVHDSCALRIFARYYG